MSSQNIQNLLSELYAIDPSLKDHRNEIEETLAAFAAHELPISLNPEFVRRLRRQVLAIQPKPNLFKQCKQFILNAFSMKHKGIVVGTVVMAAIVILIIGSFGNPGRTLGAELAYTEGAVLYRTNGGVWQEAAPNTSLQEGDGVKVIGQGRAIIILDDGSAVRLNNDSEATLAELDPTHMQVINEYGQVYTRVVKSKRRVFDVNVKGTFYRALGTAYMTVNTDETQGVEVYHSAVQVVDEGITSDETKAVVPEGSSYYEKNIEAPKKEGEVTALSTDEVAGDEFVVWNKDQDESDDKFDEQLGVLAVVATAEESATETEVAVSDLEAAPVESEETAVSTEIILSAVGSNALTWTKPEGTGGNGFKIVYSKEAGPTYPLREDDRAIYVDVGTTIPWLYAFDGSGTYHVRVCDYKADSTCGTFSNEATITLAADSNTTQVAVAEAEEDIEEEEEQEAEDEDSDEATETVEVVTETNLVPTEKYPGTPGESSVTGITLVANSPEPEHVSWTVDGNLVTGMERGIRVIFSKSPNPTYGEDLAMPVGWKNYAKIYAKEGAGTYYVRVCEFLGDRCGVYSNEVTVNIKGAGAGGEYMENGEWKSNRTSSGPAASTVSSISLTVNDPAPEHVSWTVNGNWVKGMDRGFRVLFSKSPNPTLGSALALPVGYKRFTKIWAKEGPGTYYVRVCEYLGNNSCGAYSNEVTITIGDPGSSGGEYKGDRIHDYR